jgi:hypothetical protein
MESTLFFLAYRNIFLFPFNINLEYTEDWGISVQ